MGSLASVASASTAVVVPPHVEAPLVSEDAEPAVEELVRLIKAHGFDVISPGQAVAAAEDAQQSGSFPKQIHADECRDAECAAEYRRLFDASLAIQLSLSGRRGKVRSVEVVVSEISSAHFAGTAAVEGGDLKGAIQAAYEAARARQLRGEGPWLSVAGSPAGALVYVDGIEYGSVPFERRHIEAGTHTIELRSDGFISQSRTLDVPARADHEERLQIELTRLSGRDQQALDRTWDYVLGGALAAVGAAHLIMGVQQKLKAGDCAERREGVCTSRYGDKDGAARENVLMGVGGASLVLGGSIMWGAPIARLRVDARRDAALVSLAGSF